MPDTCLYDQFLSGEIAPDAFDHRAHLEVAWHALRNAPAKDAERRMRDGLRAIAVAAGAPAKYNDTMTIAFMRLVAARAPTDSFEAFLDANDDLLSKPRDVLARHYSRERLTSEEARTAWLPPDLLPLPRRR